jgi:hypothetical protein
MVSTPWIANANWTLFIAIDIAPLQLFRPTSPSKILFAKPF